MLSNSHAAKGRRVGTPSRDRAAQAYALGWNDYIAGQSYPLEYEAWTEMVQRNYEMGRCAAAAARSVAQVPRQPLNRLIVTTIRRLPPEQRGAVSGERHFHFQNVRRSP
jgi:hypothetical protein